MYVYMHIHAYMLTEHAIIVYFFPHSDEAGIGVSASLEQS